MSEDRSSRPPERQGAHDDREIASGSIVRFTVAVFGLCVLSFGAAWWLINALGARADAKHPDPPVIASSRPSTPEGPLLQARPQAGLAILRAEEQLRLHHYAWLDRGEGVVQIPIERAMDLVAERGLPTREGAGPPAPPVTVPDEAGWGRAPDDASAAPGPSSEEAP
ncbi:MAG: hypothetical protein RIF41_07280 [Polyangiaceae bacterium]